MIHDMVNNDCVLDPSYCGLEPPLNGLLMDHCDVLSAVKIPILMAPIHM